MWSTKDMMISWMQICGRASKQVVIVKCLLSINTWEYFIAIDVYFVSKANSRMKIL